MKLIFALLVSLSMLYSCKKEEDIKPQLSTSYKPSLLKTWTLQSYYESSNDSLHITTDTISVSFKSDSIAVGYEKGKIYDFTWYLANNDSVMHWNKNGMTSLSDFYIDLLSSSELTLRNVHNKFYTTYYFKST